MTVLVDSGVPWRRLLESVFLHIVVVGMLAGLSIQTGAELDAKGSAISLAGRPADRNSFDVR
jgi:hypothetical protein